MEEIFRRLGVRLLSSEHIDPDLIALKLMAAARANGIVLSVSGGANTGELIMQVPLSVSRQLVDALRERERTIVRLLSEKNASTA